MPILSDFINVPTAPVRPAQPKVEAFVLIFLRLLDGLPEDGSIDPKLLVNRWPDGPAYSPENCVNASLSGGYIIERNGMVSITQAGRDLIRSRSAAI